MNYQVTQNDIKLFGITTTMFSIMQHCGTRIYQNVRSIFRHIKSIHHRCRQPSVSRSISSVTLYLGVEPIYTREPCRRVRHLTRREGCGVRGTRYRAIWNRIHNSYNVATHYTASYRKAKPSSDTFLPVQWQTAAVKASHQNRQIINLQTSQ